MNGLILKAPCQTFSPLFIGAMVATCTMDTFLAVCQIFQSPFHRGNGCYERRRYQPVARTVFQSPFHRGNGCYIKGVLAMGAAKELSVPFSSGQWLLRWHLLYDENATGIFQSPFHRGNGCYAGISCMTRTPQGSFSPLFIGAMVATYKDGRIVVVGNFQSPFHRGNGCYYDGMCIKPAHSYNFQSPFHRGNGCYTLLRLS